MGKNVTYLWGAGASKFAIPIVGEIDNVIYRFLHNNKQFENSIKGLVEQQPNNGKLEKELISRFCEELWLLRNAISRDFSIDSYAKQLLIQSEFEKLNSLKKLYSAIILLSHYELFTNSQSKIEYNLAFKGMSASYTSSLFVRKTDYRYKNFLVNILERNNDELIFPDNLNIVSWNYDYQYEISLVTLLNYTKKIELDIFFTAFNFGIFTHDEELNKINWKQKFIRINGDCGFKSKRLGTNENKISIKSSQLSLIENPTLSSQSFFNIFYELYNIHPIDKKEENNLFESRILFAWEKESPFQKLIETKSLGETNILVIIGYSFPFVNREIDRAILKAMHRLEKIVVQDIDDEIIKRSIRRMESLLEFRKGIEFISYSSKGDFYLPPEI